MGETWCLENVWKKTYWILWFVVMPVLLKKAHSPFPVFFFPLFDTFTPCLLQPTWTFSIQLYKVVFHPASKTKDNSCLNMDNLSTTPHHFVSFCPFPGNFGSTLSPSAMKTQAYMESPLSRLRLSWRPWSSRRPMSLTHWPRSSSPEPSGPFKGTTPPRRSSTPIIIRILSTHSLAPASRVPSSSNSHPPK